MPKKDDRTDPDRRAPVTPIVDNATERHLVKARELLREARSRFSSRDDGVVDTTPNTRLTDDDE